MTVNSLEFLRDFAVIPGLTRNPLCERKGARLRIKSAMTICRLRKKSIKEGVDNDGTPAL